MRGDYYANHDELNDPTHEETLHRGLKARQISMIAVSPISEIYPTDSDRGYSLVVQ